jgi:molecular chaperone HtpG
LKEDLEEFLEEKELKDLIQKHSEFVGYSINLCVEKIKEEISDNEDKDKKDNEENVKRRIKRRS